MRAYLPTGRIVPQFDVPNARAPHIEEQPMNVLLGCPIWGDTWIDRFLAYCLPSIVEPESRAALNGSRILLYTDQAGMRRLSRQGDLIELRELPRAANRWDALMAVQADLLKEAAQSGMGLSALQPDIVFPKGYFARLLRLGQVHEGIIGLGIWANSDTVLAEFDRLRRDGVLSIPARALGSIGWTHLHPMWRRYLMNGVDIDTAMPTSHLIGWLGTDFVRIHCSHVNPLWLSPRLCGMAKLTNTLDAILPEILAGVPPYVAALQDGLTPLEFAEPANKPQHVRPGIFPECAKAFWGNTPALELFKLPMRVPIGPRVDGMTDAEIDVEFNRVLGRLEGWAMAHYDMLENQKK